MNLGTCKFINLSKKMRSIIHPNTINIIISSDIKPINKHEKLILSFRIVVNVTLNISTLIVVMNPWYIELNFRVSGILYNVGIIWGKQPHGRFHDSFRQQHYICTFQPRILILKVGIFPQSQWTSRCKREWVLGRLGLSNLSVCADQDEYY